MGWRTTHPSLIPRILGGLLAVILCTGCGAAPVPSAAPDQAQRLNAALAQGEGAFAALFNSPLTGTAWYAVLHEADAHFAGTAQPDTVDVQTQFSGDRGVATQTIALRLAADGTIDGSVDTGPRPLWALGKTELTAAAHGTVLSSGLDESQRKSWSQRLDRASAAVSGAGVLTPANDWNGGLVVELPADSAAFTATTGSPADDTAAITTCASGTPRIVVNPVAFAQGSQWLQATLTHEAVHVATDSPCHNGTAWVVEGVAEDVAAMSDPATAKADAVLVKKYLRSHRPVTALPATVVTPTDYALAQVAVAALRWKLDDQAPAFIEAGIIGQLSAAQTAQATRIYLAALQRRR